DYKPFEEVKEDIYKTIFAQKEGKMVEDLKKELWEKYDVEIDLTALKGLVTDRAGAEARAPGEIAFGTGEASNKGNSHLRFISEAVDLGLVRTKPVSFTSLVKNTATEDLIIQKVGSSCKCAEAKIEPRKLAPGAVGKLTVSFDPKKLEKREIGDASKILIIDSTDRVQPRKFVRVDAHLVQNNG
ncbi:MAG: DUF1573 domain-containing protein, partial [Bdellovibrionales bacterium]|nr:DUF1573 domain-containing protein [Bdellovibrionales bacterium]